MSVYLDGTSVLLNSGQVATDAACCCGATPTGACCIGSECSITTAAGCAGTYQGDGTTCDPNPCPLPPCPCNPDSLYFPFYDFDTDAYYAQQTANSCTLETTYQLPVTADTRFTVYTSANNACGEDYTGSCTVISMFNLDTCLVEDGGCTGPGIYYTFPDPDECIESCGYPGDGCDGGCSAGGAPPGTINVVTLSGACSAV